MALVQEYTLEGGTRIRFYDDEYQDKTEEEKESLRKNIDRTVNDLIIDMAYGKQVG